jgi:hypothetical protein
LRELPSWFRRKIESGPEPFGAAQAIKFSRGSAWQFVGKDQGSRQLESSESRAQLHRQLFERERGRAGCGHHHGDYALSEFDRR